MYILIYINIYIYIFIDIYLNSDLIFTSKMNLLKHFIFENFYRKSAPIIELPSLSFL